MRTIICAFIIFFSLPANSQDSTYHFVTSDGAKKDYAVGADTYKTWHFKNSRVIFYEFAHVSFQEDPTWFTGHVLSFLKSVNDSSSAISGAP